MFHVKHQVRGMVTTMRGRRPPGAARAQGAGATTISEATQPSASPATITTTTNSTAPAARFMGSSYHAKMMQAAQGIGAG